MINLVKNYIAPREEMIPAIEKILYSGYIAVGEEVKKFESEFGNFIENGNVVMLNSGTAALHLSLLLLNIKDGDEVISTPMTSEPTNTAILNANAKVVWADVDAKNGLISPQSIEEKITSKTKAIVVVHYAGMVCDMDNINSISKKYNVPVIEDCAHALGAKYNNKKVGQNSMFNCFSFQAIKHLTTIDGGCIAFNSDRFIQEARELRWFGLQKNVSRLETDIKRVGYKYGMNNVNATIGIVQLKHMEKIISTYIENGKFFDDSLKNINGVHLVKYNNNTEPSYWLYTMKVENRDDFIKMMLENGVEASPLHHRNDTHTVFKHSKCDLPNMDLWYNTYVHIPCGWWVTKEDRGRIVDLIKKGW